MLIALKRNRKYFVMLSELRVSLYLLNVGPVTALRDLCMCLKFLSVGCFTSVAIPKCRKNLKSA